MKYNIRSRVKIFEGIPKPSFEVGICFEEQDAQLEAPIWDSVRQKMQEEYG